MEIPDKIFHVLAFRGRSDLANLLRQSRYDLNVSSTYGSRLYSQVTTLELYSPIEKHEELVTLSVDDKQQIISAFHVLYPVKDEEIEICYVEFFVDPEAPVPGSDESIYVPKEFDTSYWRKGYFRLFISHSALIKKKVKKLQDGLLTTRSIILFAFLPRIRQAAERFGIARCKLFHAPRSKYGISGFVAHEDIEPTKEWLNTIESALLTCDALLAMLDNNFRTSNWCDQEVGFAYGLGRFMIPVRLGIDPYGFIGKFQGIQGKGKLPKDLAVEISSLLSSSEKTKKKMAEGMIEMFVGSRSYQAARDSVEKLALISYINDALVERLESGLTENSQIREAIGVPEKAKRIIEKLSAL